MKWEPQKYKQIILLIEMQNFKQKFKIFNILNKVIKRKIIKEDQKRKNKTKIIKYKNNK